MRIWKTFLFATIAVVAYAQTSITVDVRVKATYKDPTDETKQVIENDGSNVEFKFLKAGNVIVR